MRAGESGKIDCDIWVDEPCLISLGGWRIEVETGLLDIGANVRSDIREGAGDGVEWRPRLSWSREQLDGGGFIEVVQC